jgi:hypothetical protein
MSIALADFLELQLLLSRLSDAADTNDVDAFLACWTQARTPVFTTAPPDPVTLTGRSDIAAYVGPRWARRQREFAHLNLNSVVVAEEREVIRLKTKLLAVTGSETGPKIALLANSHDEFVRERGAWFLAVRTLTVG